MHIETLKHTEYSFKNNFQAAQELIANFYIGPWIGIKYPVNQCAAGAVQSYRSATSGYEKNRQALRFFQKGTLQI